MSSSSMLSSSAVHRKGGNSFIAAENASAQRSALRQPRLASTPSSVASTTTTTATAAAAATRTAAAAPSPPQSPSAPGLHSSQSLWQQQLSVPADMAQAWTLSFEQLAGEYLSRLAALVDAYGGNGSSADAMAGHRDGAASARPPLISRSVRRTGLGGSAAEDAALELNVEDLRCVEHALLSELQAYQSHGSTSASPVLDAQAGRREAASTQAVQRDATSATPTARPSRVSAVSGMKQRGDEEGGVALTRSRSVASEHTGVVAVVGGDGEGEETGGSDGDPRPPPDSVLALFRQAQVLSAEKQQQSMVGVASPAKDSAAAATQLSASDETEAEALARLCVKYFYTPKAAPAPVTAPPPLPTADRPWSSSPTAAAAAGRRRSSGRSAQPMRGRGAAAVPPPHHHPDYSERRGNPSFPDTALFPPPNLHPNTQRKQQRIAPAPPATQPRISFATEGGGTATDAAIPMSINSPAAWRKLIEKRSAAAASSSGGGGGGASPASAAPATATTAATSKPATSTAKGTALASLPHAGAAADAARGGARRAASPATTTTATAVSRATPEDVSAPEPDTNFSFGFPPPRALFTAANVSEVLDALQTEGRDGPIRRYLGGKLGKQPAAVARAEERSMQPASQQQRQQQQQQRLPALTAKAAPRVDEQGAVQAGGTGGGREGHTRSSHGQLPLSQHATGAVAAYTTTTAAAAAAPTVQATAQPKPPNGGNMKAESRRAAARVKGHLAPTVVLPPHYHGARGEHLTTAELEQLVASVTQESAAAQSSLERSNDATNAAADELYRLQKAVAETLLENVQLEKDIATLVTGSDGGAASTSRALTVVVGVGEGPAATTTTEGAAVIAGKASSSHPSSSLVPAHRRAMLTLPAPHTAGNTGKGLATSSLLSTARSGTLTTTRRGNATLRAATVPPARLLSPTAAPASSHHSPLAILEELREATAARVAETAATLREIDALSDRIARHDALLHAVAEYWRRNAAVMKRQQFAVLAQPPLRPATVNSAGGLAVTWQSSNASRRNSHPGPASPSEYSHDSSDNSKDNSEGGRDSRSFVSRTDYSATPSGRVPELLGSPSQLERALAHMEAVSPMLPSSALSFDLHPSPSRTTENSSVPPTVKAQQRTTVRRQGAGGDDDDKEGGEEEEEEAAAAVRSHWTQSQSTPQRLLGNARGTHQQHLQQDEQLAQVEGVSSGSFLPSGAVSVVAHTATKRSLFGAPDVDSDEDEEAGKRRGSATASPPAPAASGQQPTSTNNAADACSKKAAKLPSVTHVNGGGGSTVKGVDVAAVRLPPISQPALAKGTFDATQHAVGSPLPHLSSQHTGFASTANASRRGGEGEEEVLQPGSWRTIAALQLDNVDEIAEFIYSVFERA